MSKSEVRLVETAAERADLYAFRYRVYVEEYGMTDEADHERKWLVDDYDDYGQSYAVFENGKIAGSLRVLRMDAVPDTTPFAEKFAMQPALDAFGADQLLTTSRFIIAPHLRNSLAIMRLMQKCFDDQLRAGYRLNYGDCSPHLLPFYEQLGYRRYTDGYNDTAYGFKVPILMISRDLDYLTRVRSPLRKLIDPMDDDVAARAWFSASYPAYVAPMSGAFMEDSAFFQFLSDRVARDPLHAVALLDGLTKEEAEKFLARAGLLQVGRGDKIVRRGERDDTLFAILSGIADVRLSEGAPAVAVFGAGDTFGEIGFLTGTARTADVIARSAGEVLVLSADFLERFIRTEPTIGAKVLLNLARELARRLTGTTERMMARPDA